MYSYQPTRVDNSMNFYLRLYNSMAWVSSLAVASVRNVFDYADFTTPLLIIWSSFELIIGGVLRQYVRPCDEWGRTQKFCCDSKFFGCPLTFCFVMLPTISLVPVHCLFYFRLCCVRKPTLLKGLDKKLRYDFQCRRHAPSPFAAANSGAFIRTWRYVRHAEYLCIRPCATDPTIWPIRVRIKWRHDDRNRRFPFGRGKFDNIRFSIRSHGIVNDFFSGPTIRHTNNNSDFQ